MSNQMTQPRTKKTDSEYCKRYPNRQRYVTNPSKKPLTLTLFQRERKANVEDGHNRRYEEYGTTAVAENIQHQGPQMGSVPSSEKNAERDSSQKRRGNQADHPRNRNEAHTPKPRNNLPIIL